MSLRHPKGCFHSPDLDMKAQGEHGVTVNGAFFARGPTLAEWTSVLLVARIHLAVQADEYKEGPAFDRFSNRRLADFTDGFRKTVTGAKIQQCRSVRINGARYRRCAGGYLATTGQGRLVGAGWRRGNEAYFAILLHRNTLEWGQQRLGETLALMKLVK